MSDDAKRDLRNVLVMALADGKLTAKEKDFIHRLRERLEVSKDEFRKLIKQFKANPKKVTIRRDKAAAEKTIQLMASMAAADGEVSEPEQRLLDKLAKWASPSPPQAKKPSAPPAPAAPAQSSQAAQSIEADEADARKVSQLTDAIYHNFAEWDEATRAQKLAEVAGFAAASLEGLLRILESYRVPDAAADALQLKTLTAEQLGKLGDTRAAYYLAQQVTISEADNQITNVELRAAAAEALGKIVGQSFSRDRAGVEAARQWWSSFGSQQHTSLTI